MCNISATSQSHSIIPKLRCNCHSLCLRQVYERFFAAQDYLSNIALQWWMVMTLFERSHPSAALILLKPNQVELRCLNNNTAAFHPTLTWEIQSKLPGLVCTQKGEVCSGDKPSQVNSNSSSECKAFSTNLVLFFLYGKWKIITADAECSSK